MNEEQIPTTELKFDTPNFEWHIADNTVYCFYVKKTLWNRWKWWIATKLFLPGIYEWI